MRATDLERHDLARPDQRAAHMYPAPEPSQRRFRLLHKNDLNRARKAS